MNSTIIYIPFIQKCPICGGDVTYITDSITKVERAWCLNENCDGKACNKIEYFFGKKSLNVKGISKVTITKLMDWGWVEDIPDIFTLGSHKAEWIKKAGFGVKSVDNILAAIDAGRTTTLAQVISAAGITKIGMSIALKLAEISKDWYTFVESATSGAFYNVDGIGSELLNYLKMYDYTWLTKLFDDGILVLKEPEASSQNIKVGEELQGKTIVITGKLKIFSKRADLEDFIKRHGGIVSSAVNGKTSFLINNDKDSTTKKNKDAIERGVPILTEQDFLDMFEDTAL